MSGSINKVHLLGYVGRDPEIRSTQSGDKVASLSVATSESWRDKASGERKERTEWHRVVIFNERIAEVVEQYVRKGSRLWVEGAMQTRKWTDRDGTERYMTEVVLQKFRGGLTLLDRADSGEAPNAEAYGTTKPAYSDRFSRDPPQSDPNDEIPF